MGSTLGTVGSGALCSSQVDHFSGVVTCRDGFFHLQHPVGRQTATDFEDLLSSDVLQHLGGDPGAHTQGALIQQTGVVPVVAPASASVLIALPKPIHVATTLAAVLEASQLSVIVEDSQQLEEVVGGVPADVDQMPVSVRSKLLLCAMAVVVLHVTSPVIAVMKVAMRQEGADGDEGGDDGADDEADDELLAAAFGQHGSAAQHLGAALHGYVLLRGGQLGNLLVTHHLRPSFDIFQRLLVVQIYLRRRHVEITSCSFFKLQDQNS